ncbi:hypothetical protein TNCV_1071931 [Trichonephila clavipes]|nr:hypothetical protein TNCV_1071931 [Trichonephila clavipes]
MTKPELFQRRSGASALFVHVFLLKSAEVEVKVLMRDWRKGPRPTVLKTAYVTLGPEEHNQMFQSGGQPNAKAPSVKFPSKRGTHLSTNRKDERLS